MNFRHVILTVFVLCGAFSAAAQTLVIYDARDLFPKEAWNPPCKAVFTLFVLKMDFLTLPRVKKSIFRLSAPALQYLKAFRR